MEGDDPSGRSAAAGATEVLSRVRKTVSALSANGLAATYWHYPGLTHGPMFNASFQSALLHLAAAGERSERGATYTADSARHPFWRVVGERAAERYFSRAAEGSLYQREISLPMAGAAALLTVEKHTGLFGYDSGSSGRETCRVLSDACQAI